MTRQRAWHQELCFGCSPSVEGGLHLDFERLADGSVACGFILRPEFQGPPGIAHGGIVATVLDEAASLAAAALEMITLTKAFEVRLRGATPVGEPLLTTARVEASDDRGATISAEITSPDGETVYAECTATVVVDRRGARADGTLG